jgi:hypothetical protein
MVAQVPIEHVGEEVSGVKRLVRGWRVHTDVLAPLSASVEFRARAIAVRLGGWGEI